MKINKGILLAGGSGSRLYPLTKAANKQLLPIYDKPVIYYSLTTLMLAGIRDILIISTPRDLPLIEALLGSGQQIGLQLTYKLQDSPRGLPEAFILGESFINQDPVTMVLGDNFFHGNMLSDLLVESNESFSGANIFTYQVENPSHYGVANITPDNKINVEEKPQNPKSNLAITGLYYFDGTVSERSKQLQISKRNELEIVDLIRSYLEEETASLTELGRGCVWFDVGSPKALLAASQYVEVIQTRQGVFIASPEEVAWRMGFISENELEKCIFSIQDCDYKKYLSSLVL